MADKTDPPREGRLVIILGPMFSGKTTELQRRLRIQRVAGFKSLGVKHASDERYSEDATLIAHSGEALEKDVVKANLLRDVDATGYETIGIDEAQFYNTDNDLEESVRKWLAEGKWVFMSSLDGDFRRRPFTHVLNLIPLAHEVTKLTAVCMLCRENDRKSPRIAPFSARTVDDSATILVGGAESYKAACSECYAGASS